MTSKRPLTDRQRAAVARAWLAGWWHGYLGGVSANWPALRSEAEHLAMVRGWVRGQRTANRGILGQKLGR